MEYSLESYSPAKTTTTLTPTILERSNPPWFSNLWIVSRNQRENRKLAAKAKKTTELRQWRTIMVSPPVVMLITTIQKQSNLLWIEKNKLGPHHLTQVGEIFRTEKNNGTLLGIPSNRCLLLNSPLFFRLSHPRRWIRSSEHICAYCTSREVFMEMKMRKNSI